MKQSTTRPTVPRTVHGTEDHLRSARLRLHLPRPLARREPRTWEELIAVPGQDADQPRHVEEGAPG
jgi:hypothetical protein